MFTTLGDSSGKMLTKAQIALSSFSIFKKTPMMCQISTSPLRGKYMALVYLYLSPLPSVLLESALSLKNQIHPFQSPTSPWLLSPLSFVD